MSANLDDAIGDLVPPTNRPPANVIPYAVPPAPKQPTRAPIPFSWADDFTLLGDDMRQLVEGIITEGGLSISFGISNSGKTFLVMHLAYCICNGLKFFGKRVERSAVIYVAAEGAGSIRRRVAAFEKHYGKAFGPFGLIPVTLSIMDPSADVEDLIDLVLEKQSEIGEKVGLIVFDTVQRVMAGADENAGADMGRHIAAADRIREETGAHVLGIHHAGKDQTKGARGHSSLRAAVDTEIEVTADDLARQHSFTLTKQRDLPTKGETFTFKLIPVEVGRDQWGGPLTSCVVEEMVGQDSSRPARRLTRADVAVMGYLAGQAAGVRRKAIVEALEPQGVSRAAVYRSCNDLMRTGLLTETLGLIYVPKG
jgi:putative DNA primase/helicase